MGIFELRRISSPPERVTPGSEATHLYSPRAENKKNTLPGSNTSAVRSPDAARIPLPLLSRYPPPDTPLLSSLSRARVLGGSAYRRRMCIHTG